MCTGRPGPFSSPNSVLSFTKDWRIPNLCRGTLDELSTQIKKGCRKYFKEVIKRCLYITFVFCIFIFLFSLLLPILLKTLDRVKTKPPRTITLLVPFTLVVLKE